MGDEGSVTSKVGNEETKIRNRWLRRIVFLDKSSFTSYRVASLKFNIKTRSKILMMKAFLYSRHETRGLCCNKSE